MKVTTIGVDLAKNVFQVHRVDERGKLHATAQGDGGMSVTVCNDKAGADESLKGAREWIKKNASNIQTNPPIVSEGSVIVEIQ